MKLRLLSCALTGALAASLIHQYQAPSPPAAARPALPRRVHEVDCRPADIEALGLDLEQAQLVRQVCTDCDLRTASLSERIESKEQELSAALASEEVAADQVRELARQLGQLRAQLIEQCVESVLRVRGTLSEEQLQSLESCCQPSCGG